MCRVRFGLTGIYFDSLEPNRPRDEFFQPMIAAIPPAVQNNQGLVVPEAIDCGAAIKEKASTATEISKKDGEGTTGGSSSSIDEGDYLLAKKAKTNRASVGNKRVRDSSSSSSTSSSSASAPPTSSDEGQVHRSANSENGPAKPPKPVNSRTTQKCTDKSAKRHPSTASGKLTKAHPAKRVRFAMNVLEKHIPSDDASDVSGSHSSDDSYIDPPSPTEPYDAFAGYYRTAGASRSHRMKGKIVGLKEELSTDGADGFLDSEDGSEVDVQGLPVRGPLARSVRATGKDRFSDQRQGQNTSTPPLARSKHSGSVMDQSRAMASGLESNVDRGLRPELPQASQNRPVSPLRSGGQLRYPKLRSGKTLPEPIFVVRPRFLSDAKHKWRPAYILTSSGYSRGLSKIRHEPAKTSPTRPTQIKAPNENQLPKYSALLVSDDLKNDAEFDEDLGLLVRDV